MPCSVVLNESVLHKLGAGSIRASRISSVIITHGFRLNLQCCPCRDTPPGASYGQPLEKCVYVRDICARFRSVYPG
jgi:hypothetical protein